MQTHFSGLKVLNEEDSAQMSFAWSPASSEEGLGAV